MTGEQANKKYRIRKAITIGASVAAVALATYGTYRIVNKVKEGKADIDPKTGFPLKKAGDMSDDLAAVNKHRARNILFDYDRSYSNNCMLCTTTYDLRKRGYDVKAGESTSGKEPQWLTKIYKNAKPEFNPNSFRMKDVRDKDADDAFRKYSFQKMKDAGPGARGNFMVSWPNWLGGGAHSIIWENDKNGNTVFKDAQTNKIYTEKNMKNFFDIGTTVLGFLRTDNLELNYDALKTEIPSRSVFKLERGDSEIKGLLKAAGLSTIMGAAIGYESDYVDRKVNKDENRRS